MLSANFQRCEFKCHCRNCNYDTVDKELIDVLEDLRSHFGKPVLITSGNRCPEYNKKIGGAKHSYHVKGRAADVRVKNTPPKEVQKYLDETYPDKYGIGCYSNFTHIDTRTGKGRW